MIPTPHFIAESNYMSHNKKSNRSKDYETYIKEQKIFLENKRKKELMRKHEDVLRRIEVWKNEIVPQLITDKYQLKKGKLTELCMKGIPSNIREIVWPLLVGNDLQLTRDTYQALKLQADIDHVSEMKNLPNNESNELRSDENAPNQSDIPQFSVTNGDNTERGVSNISDQYAIEFNSKPNDVYEFIDSHLRQDSKESQSDTSLDSHTTSHRSRKSTQLSRKSSFRGDGRESICLPQRTVGDIHCQSQHDTDDHSLDHQSPHDVLDLSESFHLSSRHAMTYDMSSLIFSNAPPKTLALIEYDLPRTFPTLAFFHDGGNDNIALDRILRCYAYYRPLIGYVQGMSYIAAVLLLYMEEELAFICLVNLIERRATMDFYGLQRPCIETHVKVFNYHLKHNNPSLYQHMNSEGITADMYLMDWHLSLFAKCLPLEAVVRVWDVYLSKYYYEGEGEIFILRLELGLLQLYSNRLLSLQLEDMMAFLVHFPDNIDINKLFKAIEQVRVTKREFDDRHQKYNVNSTSAISQPTSLSSTSTAVPKIKLFGEKDGVATSSEGQESNRHGRHGHISQKPSVWSIISSHFNKNEDSSVAPSSNSTSTSTSTSTPSSTSIVKSSSSPTLTMSGTSPLSSSPTTSISPDTSCSRALSSGSGKGSAPASSRVRSASTSSRGGGIGLGRSSFPVTGIPLYASLSSTASSHSLHMTHTQCTYTQQRQRLSQTRTQGVPSTLNTDPQGQARNGSCTVS